MELKSLRYKKTYNVSNKALEIVVSIFIEEKDEVTVNKFTNYEKIVSECLFPYNPTLGLDLFQKGELVERVNDLLQNKLTKYDIDKILATFAHYQIARYVDKKMLDEIVVGIKKNTNANGIVYFINNEKVIVSLAEDVKELSVDDHTFEIDDDFKSVIESGEDKAESEEESTDEGNEKKGDRKSIWKLLIVLLIVALLGGIVAIVMSHIEQRNNEPPIINRDTITQTDSTDLIPCVVNEGEDEAEEEVGDVRENEKRSGIAKDDAKSGGGSIVQDPVRKNDSDHSTKTNKVIDPANQSSGVRIDVKQNVGGGGVLVDTISFPYGLYYGEYKTVNGKRYPHGVGIMKYNQRTTLRSTVTGWRYRYVKAGYELSGVWEGESVKCGTLFDGSSVRVVLDSVPCK